MKQEQNKLSRNLNVVETFNDFSLDTLIVDFDYEDLVDYVKENADVFYWLNIESIWGRCGFVWDTYNNKGHFNNVSIKFEVLPRVPDPYRMLTFAGLFNKLNAGTYTINDNDWDNITDLGGWGTSDHIIIFNMPSANFLSFTITSNDAMYLPMISINHIDWSTLLNTLKLKITDSNRSIVKLDLSNLISLNKMSNIRLILDEGKLRDVVEFENIPEVIPYNKQFDYHFNLFGTSLIEYTLYRHYINSELTELGSKILFYNAPSKFYWPYPGEENPPIINAKSSGLSLFLTYSRSEDDFINCTVVPSYQNTKTYNTIEELVIPWDYDVFNNPNHKVKYYNYNGVLVKGAAFCECNLGFFTKLHMRADAYLLNLLERVSSFKPSARTDLHYDSSTGYNETLSSMLNRLDNLEDVTIVGALYAYWYNSANGTAYHVTTITDPDINFYNSDTNIVTFDKRLEELYDWDYRGTKVDGKNPNNKMLRFKVEEGNELHFDYGWYDILVLLDIYIKTSYSNNSRLYIPRDTTHKVIPLSGTMSVPTIRFMDCTQEGYTIPNIFDLSDIAIKEGDDILSIIKFSTFDRFLFKEVIKTPDFITVDPTLDLILLDTLYVVSKPKKTCLLIMKFFLLDYIFAYPLSRVKLIGTKYKANHKIHLEGGYVLSLDDNATEGDAEGVAYFLSKFKFRESPQPKESSLYLNSEQYALFTTELIAYLNNNGWEVIEVIIT